MKLVGDVLEELEAIKRATSEELPLRANYRSRITLGLKQYPVSSGSGHRALLEHPRAAADIGSFLTGLLSEDGIPQIAPGLGDP